MPLLGMFGPKLLHWHRLLYAFFWDISKFGIVSIDYTIHNLSLAMTPGSLPLPCVRIRRAETVKIKSKCKKEKSRRKVYSHSWGRAKSGGFGPCSRTDSRPFLIQVTEKACGRYLLPLLVEGDYPAKFSRLSGYRYKHQPEASSGFSNQRQRKIRSQKLAR